MSHEELEQLIPPCVPEFLRVQVSASGPPDHTHRLTRAL